MLNTLDIINDMLASTGTAPLTSDDAAHPFYIKADNKLALVNESIQKRGWWFNTTVRTLKQDVDGKVLLPSTTLHADPTDRSSKLVIRGDYLYDMANATDVIGKDVEINYIELLTIPDLPGAAGEYVRCRAVYEFYRDEDGTDPKLKSYNTAMSNAWVAFKGEHLKNADVNFFTGLSAAQLSRNSWGGTRSLPTSDTGA